DDLEVERAGELDHRGNHRLIDRVRVEIADEAAVDLQVIERQILQIAEGRESAAEIIERELAAHAVQHADEALRVLDIRDHRVLRHFEAELIRRHTGATENVDDELQELWIAERLARQVDRQAALGR